MPVYLWLGVEPILLGPELRALAGVWLAIGLWRWIPLGDGAHPGAMAAVGLKQFGRGESA